jgi:hypothetical protein
VLQQQVTFKADGRGSARSCGGLSELGNSLGSYDVVLRDSDLAIQPPGGAEVRLQPLGQDMFAGAGFGVLRFLRGTRGAVEGFSMNPI